MIYYKTLNTESTFERNGFRRLSRSTVRRHGDFFAPWRANFINQVIRFIMLLR